MNNIFSKYNKKKVFPACLVQLPSSAEGKRAAFYLAAEEYIARRFPEDNYLFTWQVSPTVVMGRNQVAHAELDLDFCRSEGLDVIRRKSGGGSIYADRGNIMISVITGRGAVEPLFEEYAERVAVCLRQLGAAVSVAGRNDIVVDGKGKICGNAFYHLSDRNIVHGTMLYDTDFRLMRGALTPDKAKLASKGVVSVKSRVALLKDELELEVGELRVALEEHLTDRSIRLTEDDVQYVKAIEADYYAPEYLMGRSEGADVVIQGRIPECGRVVFNLKLRGTLIKQVSIVGDYFALGDEVGAFNRAFCGREYTPASLMAALEEFHPEKTIRGLSFESLCELIEEQYKKE